MAMKYYFDRENGMTIGVLNGCKHDALHHIDRITNNTSFCAYNKKYLMPNTFRAVAKVSEGDVFDEEVGKNIVKDKVMKKYYDSLDHRMSMFMSEVYELYHKCFDEDDGNGSAT